MSIKGSVKLGRSADHFCQEGAAKLGEAKSGVLNSEAGNWWATPMTQLETLSEKLPKSVTT